MIMGATITMVEHLLTVILIEARTHLRWQKHKSLRSMQSERWRIICEIPWPQKANCEHNKPLGSLKTQNPCTRPRTLWQSSLCLRLAVTWHCRAEQHTESPCLTMVLLPLLCLSLSPSHFSVAIHNNCLKFLSNAHHSSYGIYFETSNSHYLSSNFG